MKRDELRLGQTVYLAELAMLPSGDERLLIRELEVMLLGKRFYELRGSHRKIRNTWESSMGTIKLLGTTKREAVVNLERLLDTRLHEARVHLGRREEEHRLRRLLFTEWYNTTGAAL